MKRRSGTRTSSIDSTTFTIIKISMVVYKMFLDERTIKRLKKKYTDRSIRTIDNNIKRLFRDGLEKTRFSKKAILDNFKKIRFYLAGLDKASVQKSMTHNIRSIIGMGHKGFNDLVKFYNIKDDIKRGFIAPGRKVTKRSFKGKGIRRL